MNLLGSFDRFVAICDDAGIIISLLLNSFKNQLESYKLDCLSSAIEHPGNSWELSDAVLSCIEGTNYADNKSSHNEFLKKNPYVAKRKFIKMH